MWIRKLLERVFPKKKEALQQPAAVTPKPAEVRPPEPTKHPRKEQDRCAGTVAESGVAGNALEAELKYCREKRLPFLYRQRMRVPQERYWETPEFQRLAQACAAGGAEAMVQMGAYFRDRMEKSGEDALFCQCAAQFWCVRAYRCGSEEAKRGLTAWCEANPEHRMASPGLDERLSGSAEGALLNALGFPFFEEDRSYTLSGVDDTGVVQVSSWESEDGPDEDGYGREEYYDWWYLDEHLVKPAGVGYIHSYSPLDRRNNEERFRELHDRVAALTAARKRT